MDEDKGSGPAYALTRRDLARTRQAELNAFNGKGCGYFGSGVAINHCDWFPFRGPDGASPGTVPCGREIRRRGI